LEEPLKSTEMYILSEVFILGDLASVREKEEVKNMVKEENKRRINVFFAKVIFY